MPKYNVTTNDGGIHQVEADWFRVGDLGVWLEKKADDESPAVTQRHPGWANGAPVVVDHDPYVVAFFDRAALVSVVKEA